jgi:hypothetical protein
MQIRPRACVAMKLIMSALTVGRAHQITLVSRRSSSPR